MKSALTLPRTRSEVHTKRQEITNRREAVGLSQNKLALRMGVESGAFSKLLHGKFMSARMWRKAEAVIAQEERRRVRRAATAQPSTTTTTKAG